MVDLNLSARLEAISKLAEKAGASFKLQGDEIVEWSKGEYIDYPEEEKKQPYTYARDLHKKAKMIILEYARASGVFHESYKLDYRNGEVPVILIMLAKLPWMEIDHLLDNTAQTVVEQYPIPEKNKVKEFKALVEEHVEKVVIDQEKVVEETLEQWCQIPAIRAHVILLAERLKGQNSS